MSWTNQDVEQIEDAYSCFLSDGYPDVVCGQMVCALIIGDAIGVLAAHLDLFRSAVLAADS